MTELYRPCAGIMLLNNNNHIFVGQRMDMKTPAWQMPQGGIEDNEAPREAAFRELLEEIGTNKAEIIAQYPEPLYYDLPPPLAKKIWSGKYKGQKQYWFLMRFTGDNSDINIQTEYPEFSKYRWSSPDQLIIDAIDFKADIYKVLVQYLGEII